MIVTHKINMDLARRGPMPCIEVTQGDKYSRELEIRLRMNGDAFVLPEGCRVMVNYSKTIGKDEVGGVYDTMPDGSDAWRIDGDTVTVGLAPQLCAAAGEVKLTVTLLHGGAELGCFAICLKVQGKSGDKGRRESYVNVNGFLPQPGSAQEGQYLEIEEVDAFGRVVKLKSVEAPAGGSGDWSAAEGAPGHVLNRTHWVENAVIAEETAITVDESNAMLLETAITLEIGAEYTITYNGVAYPCTSVDGSVFGSDMAGMAVLGNYALALGAGNTGEPFALLNVPGQLIYVMDLTGATTATISIARETVHKLDNKFIDAEWVATTVTGKGGTVLEETTCTDTNGGGDFAATFVDGSFSFADSKSYVVVWDATEYVCTAFVRDGAVLIGNVGLSGAEGTTNTGEPFYIAVIDESQVMIVWALDAAAHTVGVYELDEVANKLPEKFLPEGYSRDELVAAVIAALPGAEEVAF